MNKFLNSTQKRTSKFATASVTKLLSEATAAKQHPQLTTMGTGQIKFAGITNCKITSDHINQNVNNSHCTVIERIWRASLGSC
jgi:hypothetical protein